MVGCCLIVQRMSTPHGPPGRVVVVVVVVLRPKRGMARTLGIPIVVVKTGRRRRLIGLTQELSMAAATLELFTDYV